MRAVILVIAVLTSFGPSSLLAQEGKAAPADSQPAHAQDGLTRPANSQAKENTERQVMERLGPGMDWDHRKAGRDLRISPSREGDDVNRERD
jgi:hypothetical protein